jgi:MarR family transcriptional regulator, 2-MHQ and catechol-resistance regulon repressor
MGNLSDDIQSKFKNDRLKALVNIKYTANWLNSKETDFFKPFGISPQQFNILRILRGAKKEMKVQIVKERMVERAPNATRLMDKLCEKKFIERERCTHDRRVVYIKITTAGLQLLTEINESGSLSFLDKLTNEEAIQLNNLLDKIR